MKDGYNCWDKECNCWATWLPPAPGEPHGTLVTCLNRFWITPQIFVLNPVGIDSDGATKPIEELTYGR